MPFELPPARSVAVDPSQDQLRQWTLELMPRVTQTVHGSLEYRAVVTARQAPSTFFVADEPVGKPTMSRDEAAEWARRQDEYIAEQDMILVRGFIGPEPEFRTPTQLYVERANANIAGMQQQLYFPPDDDDVAELTVIYTPGLVPEGKPNGCLVTVDLDAGVTRVLGSDYFGESKMGGLRMWNHLVYERGGLAMHSGAKTFPAGSTRSGEEELALVIGLSGTGKTTTTFRDVLGSMPVQDDFIALFGDGTVHATEDGCFAKTYGLDPDDEPTIHAGATSPHAWLESTHVDPETGEIDFFDDSYTSNGRCTFALEHIRHREPHDLPSATYLFILNRNEDLIPAVAKLRPEQAAYYFMLGETKGTSAGGRAEAGRKLRVPGTNPFWFEDDSSQGNRFLEILDQHPLEVYLLNTGGVGGAGGEGSMEVTIADSAAVQEAVVGGTATWEEDPDFGYLVASGGIDTDPRKLQPRRLYAEQGRQQEYDELVSALTEQRRQYLEGFADLDPRIAKGA